MLEGFDKTISQKLGFTLIELIVVFSILAILAAILLPNMVGFVAEAKNQTMKENSKVTYTAARTALKRAYINKESLTSSLSPRDLAAYMDTLPLGNSVKITQLAGAVETVVWSDGGGHSATYYVATGSYTIT